MSRTIYGNIYKPDGSAWGAGIIQFILLDSFEKSNGVVVGTTHSITLDPFGYFSVNLETPDTGTAHYRIVLPNSEKQHVYISAGASMDIQTLLTIAESEVDPSELQLLLDASTASVGFLKVHRITNQTFLSADQWHDIVFEEKVSSESTDDFSFFDENLVTEDKSIIISNTVGLFLVLGCIHPTWLGNANDTPLVAVRVITSRDNGSTWVEKRCLQVLTEKGRGADEHDTMPYHGSIDVVANEQIKLQVQVSDTNLILAGVQNVFDNPISATMTFYGVIIP